MTLEVGGTGYQRSVIFKHDAWAATALYENAHDRIICKFGRTQSLVGLPMRWLGIRMARHERRVMQRLADLPLIPRDLGPVSAEGQVLPCAMARRFIEGSTLIGRTDITPDFLISLHQLLLRVHEREVAYVDMNKPDNVLIGEDGKPHLIDFQISYMLPTRGLGRNGLSRWWLKLLQEADLYHLSKHVRHYAPAGSAPTLRIKPPWFIRLHRFLTVPLRQLRRKWLVRLRVRSGAGRAESEKSQLYTQ